MIEYSREHGQSTCQSGLSAWHRLRRVTTARMNPIARRAGLARHTGSGKKAAECVKTLINAYQIGLNFNPCTISDN